MKGHVAVIGAGLVGSGWAIVFARAGKQVRVYDANAVIRDDFLTLVSRQLIDLKTYDLVDDPSVILARITVCVTLDDAVCGAYFVQESVFEEVAVKTEISIAIGQLLNDDAIVGSSTSGIPSSAFTSDVKNRERFLVTHPVNPPYLVPIVEVVPAPWTTQDAVDRAFAFMEEVGQSPILVRREVEGFILNRLQGALLREAWDLFAEGYASANDIDKTVSEGLGLRWSFMGPFETIDLNAPGGIGDYAERLGPLYHAIQKSRKNPQPWNAELISGVDEERRSALPLGKLPERCNWRDQRLMALAAHKAGQTS